MRVQLDRKLANRLDGVDVAAFHEGEVIDLPAESARLLLAEGWAHRVDVVMPVRAQSAAEVARRAAHRVTAAWSAPMLHRRTEDKIREEAHDERARVLGARH